MKELRHASEYTQNPAILLFSHLGNCNSLSLVAPAPTFDYPSLSTPHTVAQRDPCQTSVECIRPEPSGGFHLPRVSSGLLPHSAVAFGDHPL